MQETWDVSIDYCEKHLEHYTRYFCRAKTSSVGGRPMDDVTVFVKIVLSLYFKRLCEDFVYGVILVIDKSLFGMSYDCVFCTLYIPPANSPFYDNKDISAFSVLQDTLLENRLFQSEIIICGDLNARTGNELDFESQCRNVPELDEFNEILDGDIGVKRTSCDSVVNNFGKQLLQFCKTYSCYIVNGRFGTDKDIGEYTFINQNGSSVIDYFIASKSVLHRVHQMEVVCNSLCNHLPLMMELDCNITDVFSNSGNVSEEVKFNINQGNCDDYARCLADRVIEGHFDNFVSLVENQYANADEIVK